MKDTSIFTEQWKGIAHIAAPRERCDVDEGVRLELGRAVVDRICTVDLLESAYKRSRQTVLPERTRRPSASVLSISMDLPFIAYTLQQDT